MSTYNVIIQDSLNTAAAWGPLRGNRNITSIDLCNVPFKNNSMNYAFSGCTNLTTVTNINSDVTNMVYTYQDCYNLTTAPSIPSNVTNIAFAFYRCNRLTQTSIEIPPTVQDTRYCFGGCTNLTNPPNIPSNIAATELYAFFLDCHNLTSYTKAFPSHLTGLGAFFWNCVNLTSIPSSLPSGLKDMSQMFYNCRKLTTFPTLPSTIENIAEAFDSCVKMTGAVTVPASVINISETFGSSNVTTVTLSGKNISSGMFATFYNCLNLTTVTGLNSQTKVDYNSSYMFTNSQKIATINMAASNYSNLFYAFRNCYGLTSVNLHNCPKISDLRWAFSFDNKLSSVNLNNTSNTPYRQAVNMHGTFYNCINLPGNVYLPFDYITEAYECFGNTSSVKNVYIPFRVKTPLPITLYKWVNGANDSFYIREYINPYESSQIPSYVYTNVIPYNQDGSVNVNYANVVISGRTVYATNIQTSVNLTFSRPMNNATATYTIPVNDTTPTYDSFKKAGYDRFGTLDGVCLKDWYGENSDPEIDIDDSNYTITFEGMHASTGVADVAHLMKYIGTNASVTVPIGIKQG